VTGVVAAIMSTISSLINSAATVFSIDIYRDIFRRNASDKRLMNVGRISGVVAILLACAIAPLVGLRQNVFLYFQDSWAVLAVPVAVVFTLGALWRRATPSAAWATMLLTILYLPITFIWRSAEDLTSFESNGILWLYNLAPGLWNAAHQVTTTMHYFTFVCLLWLGTYVFMVLWSLSTRDALAAEHANLVWKPAILRGLPGESPRPWYLSVGFWSIILAALFITIYAALW
jgi:SSS family solute:Na+ symporter